VLQREWPHCVNKPTKSVDSCFFVESSGHTSSTYGRTKVAVPLIEALFLVVINNDSFF
jgi:hypothetical protein